MNVRGNVLMSDPVLREQLLTSTIRRAEFPAAVTGPLNAVRSLVLQEAPIAPACSYKFAASIEELKYVARRVIKDDVRAMELQAPPGVGKTTLFPVELSRLTQDVIVVLEPSVMLVKAQCATLRSMGHVASVMLAEDLTPVPIFGPGVVFTTPAVLLIALRLLSLPGVSKTGVPSLVVLHDECHENDGASFAVRRLWATFPLISRYVMMSATTAGNRAEAKQRHNTAKTLTVCKYPPVDEVDITVKAMSPAGQPLPWSVVSVAGKRVLMFVESDVEAARLQREYAAYLPVECLRRYHPYSEYERVRDVLSSSVNTGVVVLVDSGYQTGYTFDIDVVIDFGIRRQTRDNGVNGLDDEYRLVTAAERRQRVERAGRFRAGVAYIPNEPAKEIDSILAPGEVGHAGGWHVMLGYHPPLELCIRSASRLYRADLFALFASGMPWALWERDFYVELPTTREEITEQCEPVPVPPRITSFSARRAPMQPVGKKTVPTLVSGTSSVAEDKKEVPLARGSSPPLSAAGGPDNSASVDPLMDALHWAEKLDKGPRGVSCAREHFYTTKSGFPGAGPIVLDKLLNGRCDVTEWLRREVADAPPSRLVEASEVCKVMTWSMWLTAWNANEAEACASSRKIHELGDSPATQGKGPLRGELDNCMKLFAHCQGRRHTLRSWYVKLMGTIPIQLYGTSSERYFSAARRAMQEVEMRRERYDAATVPASSSGSGCDIASLAARFRLRTYEERVKIASRETGDLRRRIAFEDSRYEILPG